MKSIIIIVVILAVAAGVFYLSQNPDVLPLKMSGGDPGIARELAAKYKFTDESALKIVKEFEAQYESIMSRKEELSAIPAAERDKYVLKKADKIVAKKLNITPEEVRAADQYCIAKGLM